MVDRLARRAGRLALGLLLGSCLVLAWWRDGDVPEARHACAGQEWEDGWCEVCGVGYLAGIPIRSAMVYDALDAHGHDYEVASIACASCQEAIPREGFCFACRRGYWRGLAWFSRLSYELARAERAPAGDCPTCAELRGAAGWCDASDFGWVGNATLRDREAFERAQAAYHVLMAALEESERCELCAAAMTVDGVCPTCRLAYEAGQATPLAPR